MKSLSWPKPLIQHTDTLRLECLVTSRYEIFHRGRCDFCFKHWLTWHNWYLKLCCFLWREKYQNRNQEPLTYHVVVLSYIWVYLFANTGRPFVSKITSDVSTTSKFPLFTVYDDTSFPRVISHQCSSSN